MSELRFEFTEFQNGNGLFLPTHAPTLGDIFSDGERFVHIGCDGLNRISVCLIRQTKALFDSKALSAIQREHVDFESAFKKSWYTLLTISSLLTPHRIHTDFGDVELYDFPSARSLARIMYENAIALRYIFCHQNADDLIFWHSIWRINGHRARAKTLQSPSRLDPTRKNKDNNPEGYQENENLLLEYTKGLEETAKYKGLQNGRQAKAKKGEWRCIESASLKETIPWKDMAKKVGISEFYGQVGYGFGSSYVHTDAVSAFQITDGVDANQQKRSVIAAALDALAYHSHALQSYVLKYPDLMKIPDFDKIENFIHKYSDFFHHEHFPQPGNIP